MGRDSSWGVSGEPPEAESLDVNRKWQFVTFSVFRKLNKPPDDNDDEQTTGVCDLSLLN